MTCSMATMCGPRTRGSLGRASANGRLAWVAELYCNFPSVSSQILVWRFPPSPLRTYVSDDLCSPAHAELSFYPPLEPQVFCDLMSPLENSPLRAEKHRLDFDLGGLNSCQEQIQNLLDDSTGHTSTKCKDENWCEFSVGAVSFKKVCSNPCCFSPLRNARWNMSFESQQCENLLKQSVSHWYWWTKRSIPSRPVMVVLCNGATRS